MNKLLISLIGALTIGTALPALASPDWQAIERARKAKQATQIERHSDPYETAGPTGSGMKCAPQAPTLLLDHGPRAQTTPYQNKQRQERYEADLKACQAASK